MRKGLITISLLVVILGVAALISGIVSSSVVYLIWGGALLAAILLERFRYKRIVRTAPPGWQRTEERFVDDETGKMVTVYIKPETGERTYVQE